jgi:hypothetical protein
MYISKLSKFKIRKLCFNLLDLPEPKRSKAFRMLKTCLKKFIDSSDNLEEIAELYDQIDDDRKKSLLSMAMFLWAFEGLYSSRLDFVCYLLILSGKLLHDPYARKYPSSIGDLRKIPIYRKFEFLDKCGFDMLLREEDRELRNRIAHNSFSLDKKGDIRIGDKRRDVFQKLKELCKSIMILDGALLESLNFTILKAHAQGLLVALNTITPSGSAGRMLKGELHGA